MFKLKDEQARATIIAAYISVGGAIVITVIAGILAIRSDAARQVAEATSAVLAGVATQGLSTQAALRNTIEAPTVLPPPTQTPYPTYTRQPTLTPYPTYTPRPTYTEVPLPTATPTLSLALPFHDEFDTLKPEWNIVFGELLIDQGVLKSAGDYIWLEIGNETLTEYTVQFDFAAGPRGGELWGPIITQIIGRDFKYFSEGGSCYWSLKDETIGGGLACPDRTGQIKLVVRKNHYVIIQNGIEIVDTIYDKVPQTGPYGLIVARGHWIDNFVLTVP